VISVDGEYVVSVGSKYSVNVGDDDPTVGIFRGYSAMGTETAMVFELENGKLRFISLPQIIYLDLLDAPKKTSKKKDQGSVYYG